MYMELHVRHTEDMINQALIFIGTCAIRPRLLIILFIQ